MGHRKNVIVTRGLQCASELQTSLISKPEPGTSPTFSQSDLGP